jgi:hypothetical protein
VSSGLRWGTRVGATAILAIGVALVVPGTASASPGGDRVPAPSVAPAAAVPAQELADAVGGLAVKEYADTFAGLKVDRATNRVIVFTTDVARGQMLAARGKALAPLGISRSAAVEVRAGKYARPQMQSATAEIWKLAEGWKSAGVSVHSIVLKSDGSGLEVRTNEPTTATALMGATASKSIAVDPSDIRYVAGKRAVPTDRFDPAAPWQGGIPIKWDWSFNDWDCTSAFAARRGSTEYLVTAEHCFDQGDVIEDGGDDRIGGVAQENTITDSAIITTDASPQVWVNDDVVLTYGAAALSWDGELVCQSGYTSMPNRCNIFVTNEFVEWNFDDGKGPRRGVEGRQCAGCNAVAHGDSGGPVWATRSDGVLTSRGIVSGGHTPVEEGVSYEFILWTETPAVLNALGLTFQT